MQARNSSNGTDGADGGVARKKLPEAEASIVSSWAQYHKTTRWQIEHTACTCTVEVTPVAGALQVCACLPRGDTLELGLTMQGDEWGEMPVIC